MQLTYQQFKEALIKSGCFHNDASLGIQFSYADGYNIEDELVDLLNAINEVLEETED